MGAHDGYRVAALFDQPLGAFSHLQAAGFVHHRDVVTYLLVRLRIMRTSPSMMQPVGIRLDGSVLDRID